MFVRISAIAAALGLLATGCGGGGPSRRDAVAGYIDDVNAIQAKLAAPARAVSHATRRLAKPNADRGAVAEELSRAAQRIDRLRRRVAALSPPAGTRRLRSLVLELMRREASLARELAAVSTFTPAFQAALRPLVPAGAQLKRALSAKGTPAAKAGALDAYAASIDSALRRLEALRPPAVSAPAYRNQVAALERVRAASMELTRALREKKSKELPALLRRFEHAAVSNQTLAAQREQIAAVRAYNHRVHGLSDLSVRIQQERLRLQKVLEN